MLGIVGTFSTKIQRNDQDQEAFLKSEIALYTILSLNFFLFYFYLLHFLFYFILLYIYIAIYFILL